MVVVHYYTLTIYARTLAFHLSDAWDIADSKQRSTYIFTLLTVATTLISNLCNNQPPYRTVETVQPLIDILLWFRWVAANSLRCILPCTECLERLRSHNLTTFSVPHSTTIGKFIAQTKQIKMERYATIRCSIATYFSK